MKTEHARIAEAVVAELFTNGAGVIADRLELVLDSVTIHGQGRYIGGLGRQAVRNAVLRALRDHEGRAAQDAAEAVANCLCHDISGRCTHANCGERSRHHTACGRREGRLETGA